MGKDPSMPFYINDWLSSPRVLCMTLEQQGAYVRLLCHCWASGDASLADCDDTLAVLSSMGEGWLKNGCPLVRTCFVPHPKLDGCLTNIKLYELWKERELWRKKSVEGGKRSAANRRRSKELGTPKGGSRKVERVVDDCLAPNGNSSSSSSSSIKPPPNPLPVTTESDSVGGSWGGDVSWGQVRERLIGLGLSSAPRLTRDLAGRDESDRPTATETWSAIDYWENQRPAWDLGALHNKIATLRAAQPLATGWPQRAAASDLIDRRAERDRKYEQLQQDTAAAQAAKAADDAHLAEQDELHGAYLDSLLPEAVIELIRASEPDNAGMAAHYVKEFANKGLNGMVRAHLIQHIAKGVSA